MTYLSATRHSGKHQVFVQDLHDNTAVVNLEILACARMTKKLSFELGIKPCVTVCKGPG